MTDVTVMEIWTLVWSVAIDGIPVYSTVEEAEAKAKEIGCEGYHEHTTAEGLKVYMPCSHHGKALDNVQDNAQREFDVDATGLPNFTRMNYLLKYKMVFLIKWKK